MSESHSTAPAKQGKPTKPYPDFPLTAHPAGYWCKKIRGKLHYFGPWADPDGALEKYLSQKDALHAGRRPREESEGTTIKELCNKFLNVKATLRDTGELAPRSWHDYKQTCDLIVRHFGKGRLIADLGPEDFARLRAKMAKRWGLVTLNNAINRVQIVFKFAFDDGLIDRPVRYGQSFERPNKTSLRRHKAQKGRNLFTPEEIHRLLAAASPQLRAMMLLGINCGFGNADCGSLPLSAVDLDGGWIDFPRPKTGTDRRCPLWPETVQAIREALACRPEPKRPEHAGLVFVTKYGAPWAKLSTDNTLAKEVGKLLRALSINGRKGRGFYTLRHTFRTVADEVKDQPAIYCVMGHEIPDISSHYREGISDARLRAVTDHVRSWLYPSAGETATPAQRGKADEEE